jgi:hypothetical protein
MGWRQVAEPQCGSAVHKTLETPAIWRSRQPPTDVHPHEQLGVTGRIKLHNASIWAKYSHTGNYTTPDNLSSPVDGYELLDLGLEGSFQWQGWQLHPHLRVHNALNHRYEVYPYVPQPGISVYGGVELRLAESESVPARERLRLVKPSAGESLQW